MTQGQLTGDPAASFQQMKAVADHGDALPDDLSLAILSYDQAQGSMLNLRTQGATALNE